MTQWGLDNLFNPGKRHMDDEKRRLQSTREEVGDNSGGRRIDLESGAVSISVPRRGATKAATEATEATEMVEVVEALDLDAALEAETEPDLALSAEADLEPEVTALDPEAAEALEDEVVAEPAAEPVAEVSPEASPELVPLPAPVAAPEPAPAATRKLSAAAWARRG